MIRVSPVLRITFGLVLLTVSMLFIGDMAGLAPDEARASVDARKKLSEALAVQLSVFASNDMLPGMNQAIDALVTRNEDVLSAALRTNYGGLIAEAGDHQTHWVGYAENGSTPTHIQVPIFNGDAIWGNLEARFIAPDRPGLWDAKGGSVVKLAAFIVLFGFVSYFLLIKKVLRELDPSKVIPARVKATLDSLAEGVVILDEEGQIVLANAIFAEKTGLSDTKLLGKKISLMSWEDPARGSSLEDLPWERAMRENRRHTGIPLALRTGPVDAITFMVNASPIFDGKERLRGSMATFDDVTELERKNAELAEAMELLKSSQNEVERKNRQLSKLATEDPLTECLNRRALFERAQTIFAEKVQRSGNLSCIMGDIDHFKRINDNFGHAAGDDVIRKVAGAMKFALRESDLLGRYGGEEFCIILPTAGIEAACAIAERIREEISRLKTDVRITVSFGVSSLELGPSSLSELIGQADEALYYSKNNGRNRVSDWGSIERSKNDPSGAAAVEVPALTGEARRLSAGPSADPGERMGGADGGPIFSRLATDPRFRPIIGRFVSQLGEQLAAMETCRKEKDFGNLLRLAHWFKGDGGTIGFDVFSEAARDLEQLAKEETEAGMDDAIGALKSLGRRVLAAYPEVLEHPARTQASQPREAKNGWQTRMAQGQGQKESRFVAAPGVSKLTKKPQYLHTTVDLGVAERCGRSR